MGREASPGGSAGGVALTVGARQGRDTERTSLDAFKGHRVLARATPEVHTLLNVSEALQQEPRGSVRQQ